MGGVYGHDLSRRIGSVASSIGIPQGAASSLMGMIMPTVVGVLGREVRERASMRWASSIGYAASVETVERTMPADLVNRAGPPTGSRGARVVEPPHRHLHQRW